MSPEQMSERLAAWAATPSQIVRWRWTYDGWTRQSDVLPVMVIGGHAGHVRYHITWELERVDDHDEDVTELASIADVPLWLGITDF